MANNTVTEFDTFDAFESMDRVDGYTCDWPCDAEERAQHTRIADALAEFLSQPRAQQYLWGD